MGIRKKFKDMCKKLSDKKSRKDLTDSELSVEEVVEEEIFPEGKRHVRRNLNSHLRAETDDGKTSRGRKCCKSSCANDKKPPSKRTRPTNGNYQMIDPDNDTIDAGKS